MEIIYEIGNKLQWSEKVALSQTCRPLWHHLRQSCCSMLRDATAQERKEYLFSLGNILPDCYWCFRCSAMHRIDPRDIPLSLYSFPGNSGTISKFSQCDPWMPMEKHFEANDVYKLARRHVQLAIKYSRMEGVHERYRMDILQRHSGSLNNRFPLVPRSVDFTAEPRVVHGRFILKMTYMWDGTADDRWCWKGPCRNRHFCRHYRGRDSAGIKEDKMRWAFAHSVKNLGRRTYSCQYCPTDFSMRVIGRKRLVFLWYDLGTGESPEDPYWQSHVPLIYYEGTPSWDLPTFPYEHGSIREMYEEGS